MSIKEIIQTNEFWWGFYLIMGFICIIIFTRKVINSKRIKKFTAETDTNVVEIITCSQFGIKDENAFLEGDNIDIYVDSDNPKVFIDEKSREYGNERKFMYIRMIDTIVFFILLMAFNIYILIR